MFSRPLVVVYLLRALFLEFDLILVPSSHHQNHQTAPPGLDYYIVGHLTGHWVGYPMTVERGTDVVVVGCVEEQQGVGPGQLWPQPNTTGALQKRIRLEIVILKLTASDCNLMEENLSSLCLWLYKTIVSLLFLYQQIPWACTYK